MFISQNVLVHFVKQALRSGLSCFSSPDRQHLIKITTLSALQSPKTVIYVKSCSKSLVYVLPGIGRGGKSHCRAGRERGDLGKSSGFCMSQQRLKSETYMLGTCILTLHSESGDTHRHHSDGNLNQLAEVWAINHHLTWPMEPGQSGEDKLCDDAFLVADKLVLPGYIFRHLNTNLQVS